MALTNPWPGVTGVTTTTDARKALAGLIETDTSGVVRAGIFPAGGGAIVTARGDMNVDIAIFQGAAVQFGGPILITNDGVAQLPSVLVSPGSGTNYYIVYAKQNESTAPGTDGSNTKVFGAQLSTTSFAVARAALPTGALELATVQMPTGKTATNNGGVTITQTFQYTAADGGVVLLRNSTESDAWNPADGALGYRIDLAAMVDRISGVWVPRLKKVRLVAGTASGSLTTGVWTNLAAQQTIPASPFGAGIPYSVRVFAISNATLTAAAYAIRVLIDGSAPTVGAQAQVAGSGGISVSAEGRMTIASPNSTHTVDVQIDQVSGTVAVQTGAAISYFIIELERVETF